jgi:hypothetical protein
MSTDTTVQLVGCGSPEEGRDLIPQLARMFVPKRDLKLAEFEALYPPMAGGVGTNVVPLEGLDMQLYNTPIGAKRTVSAPASLFLRLFTSQTATTVPSDDSKITGGASGVPSGTSAPAEPASANSYASVTMASGGGYLLSGNVWGAPAAGVGTGRKTTATQQSFPQSSGSWGTINGVFLATLSNTAVTAILTASPTSLTSTLVTAAPSLTSTFAGGVTMFYGVTAVTAGGETLKSNEPASVSPSTTQAVQLAWTAPAGPQPISYRIYRSVTTGTETTSPALVAEVPGDVLAYVDTGAGQGKTGTTLNTGAAPSSSTAEQGVALFYANFSDGNSVAINATGFTLQVTPSFEIDHV